MFIDNIEQRIKSIEKNINKNLKKIEKISILKSDKNNYKKDDKEDFLLLWLETIKIFDSLKKLIKKYKYKKYIFFYNYNKLVISRYLAYVYYNYLVEINKIFWWHHKYLYQVLEEKYSKNYFKYMKYIYRLKFINLINTPNVFFYPFKIKINKKLYKYIDINAVWVDIQKRVMHDSKHFRYYINNKSKNKIFKICEVIWVLLSRIRFSTRTKWLISKKNLKKYLEISKPWDILLTRWNWNATNIPIPWFWKHMSLFLWKWEYLSKNFDKYLNKKINPKKYYIIESTSDWILVKDIDKLIKHNDYLWVFRTNFSTKKTKQVIRNALKEQWKWYDYWLNYYSNENMVCSELVLKSYQKQNKKDEWIEIVLKSIWTSLSFPPNNFFKILKKNKIDTIFFIDSVEKTWKNFINSNNELLKSQFRFRFTFLNK